MRRAVPLSAARLIVLVVALLAATLAPVRADLDDGEAAFKRRDYRAAMTLLAPLADAGDARAQFYVGSMHLAGLGVPRDEAKGVELLAQSAAAGDAQAQALLGQLYLRGRGVAKDLAKGAELTQRAAEGGVPGAQLALGILLRSGAGGFLRDDEAAFRWFKAAADQGYAPAYSWVGDAYARGRGVAQDEAQAVAWWRKGAEAKDRSGQYFLARAYLEGKGGLGRDVKAALGLLAASANQGYPAAQALLGTLYERGAGLPADYVLAHMWLNLARAQGVGAARDRLAELEKKMTPEQIAEAQRRARDWRTRFAAAQAMARRAPAGSAPGSGTRSGSGFVVSAAGHVVTNDHVVAGCNAITLAPGGVAARVVARDARNDLALLQREPPVAAVAAVRTGGGVRPGDEIVVVGYPLRGLLAANPVVTTGTVSALGGLANDTSKLQIAAPVQQGSSGGPLLDRHGLVVGVVQSKINALSIAARTGDIPQNVNFAVNGATLTAFLEASGVDFRRAVPGGSPLAAADVGEAASAFTVSVECAR